ncbi:antibiotic biosynthesis monooxygenase [Klebsiella pneumoniae]|nr:antibiotic biosynthesis monooxygenase [Klebsiella pneumoniae]
MISLIAVLKAKPGQTDALRQALQALLLPTRQEPGNLDYALFQLRDAPETFYMREAWQGQDALRCPCRDALFSGVYGADGVSAG